MSNELRDVRIEKRDKVSATGAEPYGRRYETDGFLAQIRELYKEDEEVRVRVAGRVMANRKYGKAAFLDVRDRTGSLQVYVKKNDVGDEAFEIYKLLDVGDFIGAEGILTTTRTGEITVFAQSFQMLSKSLLPLPEKFHGLQDQEQKYRKRYLDLTFNQESLDIFTKRDKIIQIIRRELLQRDFMEVETPMMHPIAGGAVAKPFVTHHNALDMPLYMRIAPELYLKRLLVGGLDRVFEINRNFRNEGISTRHNPEFTMMEVYQAYGDYHVMMDLTEHLLGTCADELELPDTIEFRDFNINMARPWKRISYYDLLKEHAGLADPDDDDAVIAKAKELKIDIEGLDQAGMVDEIFEKTVEPNLVDPTFVIDFPAAHCPLTKRKKDNPKIAERFELYIACTEIANAYSELNDPAEQKQRFLEQVQNDPEKSEDDVDFDYITALEHGMPPAGGLGIGIDRIVMILTGAPSIRDVILFPLLKKEQEG
jgi:lysyl-tRNA synthetase, class II